MLKLFDNFEKVLNFVCKSVGAIDFSPTSPPCVCVCVCVCDDTEVLISAARVGDE